MNDMKKYLFLLPVALAAACNSGTEFTSHTVEEPCTEIVAYLPAPGQFINDPTSGFDGVDTPEKAVAYAEKRFAAGTYVSLGGWGGCIVVRFDKPVPATGGYDLWVQGNQTSNSSEPGIVWVARDDDGDGAADDGVWYELRGSEYGKSGYRRNYSVTYTRPADRQDVAWSDSEGATGTIDYLPQFHAQANYYPAWLVEDEITFTGSLLPYNGEEGIIENTPSWLLRAYEWGYADNYSPVDAAGQRNRLSIGDAVTADGTPANLSQISLVKVQTGVNGKSPLKNNDIGETSTEVCGIGCYRVVTKSE